MIKNVCLSKRETLDFLGYGRIEIRRYNKVFRIAFDYKTKAISVHFYDTNICEFVKLDYDRLFMIILAATNDFEWINTNIRNAVDNYDFNLTLRDVL